MTRSRSAIDWAFRSRETGRITIGQRPNLPLAVFFVTVALRWFVGTGSTPRVVVDWISALSLGWWAVDELVRGVNPWRRLLGIVGIGLAVSAGWSLAS